MSQNMFFLQQVWLSRLFTVPVTIKPLSKSWEQFFQVISVPIEKKEGCGLGADDNVLIMQMDFRPKRQFDLELLWMLSVGRDLYISFACQHWKRCLTLNGLTVVYHLFYLQYPHTSHLYTQFWGPEDYIILIWDFVLTLNYKDLEFTLGEYSGRTQ